jgi:hypothetical protein
MRDEALQLLFKAMLERREYELKQFGEASHFADLITWVLDEVDDKLWKRWQQEVGDAEEYEAGKKNRLAS